jgi:hypothetical protein
MAKDPKESNCKCVRENILSVNEDIDLSSSGGECRNPTLAKCEDETHTPKVGELESSGSPECLELDSKRAKHLALGCSWCHSKGLEV